jgi:hypothetical protein
MRLGIAGLLSMNLPSGSNAEATQYRSFKAALLTLMAIDLYQLKDFNMKKLALALLLATISTAIFAQQYVNGYTRKDGTYVEGHYRSAPNNVKWDNYSSQGNYNPYNGKIGHENPYGY